MFIVIKFWYLGILNVLDLGNMGDLTFRVLGIAPTYSVQFCEFHCQIPADIFSSEMKRSNARNISNRPLDLFSQLLLGIRI